MSIAQVLKLDIDLMCQDVPARIGLHYRLLTGPTPGYPANDLVVKFATQIAKVQAVLATNTYVMRIIARCLEPTFGIPFEGNYTESFAGTSTAEPLAPSLALLLRMRTDSTLSKNNGHMYIPGVPEAKWIDGKWDATYLSTPVADFCQLMVDTLDDADGHKWKPCVVSRYLAGVKRGTPVTYDIITCEPQPKISQQRRRQSGQQGIKA